MRKTTAILLAAAMAMCTACTPASVTQHTGTQEPAEDTQKTEAPQEEDAGKAAEASEGAEDVPAEADDEEEEIGIERDIPDLKDIVASSEGLGEDAVCGACLGTNGMNDGLIMELAEKHFNAITLENELKMDAMFGYSNESPRPGSIHDEELNGHTIAVPKLDHSKADAILDKILEWNGENPGSRIKVRGHVLVWHSQAPEWFFHEGYDKNNDYVSREEMDERLEWYIKSMLEYYTGDDSSYKGLFYAWDVVNEAVSDRGGAYRSDTEPGSDSLTDSIHGTKSSWWKVYGSNEFIINAFRYANKYAPADLELYYNDYNECDRTKMKGIIGLINDVKNAEGTRIDGFGMQGHYSVNAPTAEQIADAARQYAEAAGKIMITELDVKPSMFYDGSEEKLGEEYLRQGRYYLDIYETMKKLKNEGITVGGITFWGTTDSYTWLPGKRPLLFDEDYRAKPAYWAFADPAKLDGMTD